jgi:hypothetical protein
MSMPILMSPGPAGDGPPYNPRQRGREVTALIGVHVLQQQGIMHACNAQSVYGVDSNAYIWKHTCASPRGCEGQTVARRVRQAARVPRPGTAHLVRGGKCN